MEKFEKEGYYWIRDKTDGNTYILEYINDNKLFSYEEVVQYLGETYEDFLGKFKLKAS